MKGSQLIIAGGIVAAAVTSLGVLLLAGDPTPSPPPPLRPPPKPRVTAPKPAPIDLAPVETPVAVTTPAPTSDPAPIAGPAPELKALAGAARSLKVEVVTATGEPLVAALVKARTDRGKVGDASTNLEGLVTFEDLVPGDGVMAEVWHPRYATPRFLGPVEPGTHVRLIFPDEPGGALELTLVDDMSRALDSAEVTIQDTRGRGYTFPAALLPLDPSGKCELTLAPGRFAVSAEAAGLAVSDKEFVTIEVDGRAAVELRLLRLGRVQGQVIAPIDPGLNFVFECVHETGSKKNPFTRSFERTLPAARSGEFEVDALPPGRYQMRVRLAELPEQASDWVGFILEPGADTRLTFTLKEQALSMEGIIEDMDGHRLEGVEVRCRTVNTRSNANGEFQLFGLPRGFQLISFEMEGYAKQSVEVVIHEQHHDRKLIRMTRFGEVTGRVLRKGGAPWMGARVSLVSQAADRDGEVLSEVTDEDGVYRFAQVLPGPYYVAFGTQDVFAPDGKPAISVAPGRPVRVVDLREP